MKYWTQLGTEMFAPSSIVAQARVAEQAGFDALNVSDHLQPWWEPGESGHAWVILGAIAEATSAIPIGSGVTAPVFRHNPVMVAQAWKTIEELAPGRAFLGIGSGEALNESPAGMDWPAPAEQVARMEEALEIISRLWDGERLDYDGDHFRTKRAFLHTNPERRPPIHVSAFAPEAARVAARWGDGLWTLADPETAPEIIGIYTEERERLGKDVGEIILQTGFSYAESEDRALEASRVWKGTQPGEHYREDIFDPKEIERNGAEQVSDEDFKQSFIIGPDPDLHVERIREVERLGATVVCLQNGSGADPIAGLSFYGQQVLPALREGDGS